MAEDQQKSEQSQWVQIRYAPTDEEEKQKRLNLAGGDAKRRAAVLHWYDREDVNFYDKWSDCLDVLEFTNSKVERADIERIQLFPELIELRFVGSPLTPDLFQLIAGHPNITHLDYIGVQNAGNHICTAAATLRQLQSLSIDGNAIDNEGIQYLKNLRELRCLSIRNAKVTAVGLRHLLAMRHLMRLDLVDCPLANNECLSIIAQMKRLECVALSRTAVTDEGVVRLTALSKLHFISLDDTAITDQSIQRVANSANFTSVTLANTAITNESIKVLQSKPRLYRLHVSNTSIDDECVPYLEAMTTLTDVDLRGTKITADGVRRIQAQLKYPILSDYGNLPTKLQIERNKKQ